MNLPGIQKVIISSTAKPEVLARQLMAMIQNVVAAVNPMLARPRAFSFVQSVDLIAATPKEISHKLGATPLGWIVTDKNANADVWRTAQDDKTITLQSDADCTIQLEVY